MNVLFHEAFYEVYASDPAAAPGRIEAVVEVIADHVNFLSPKAADEEDLLRVHTTAHMEWVTGAGVFDVAALAAGGAVEAAEGSFRQKEPWFALIRPPGHHASAGSAWGFCYFNNMAVALERMKAKGRIEKAYVLDIDLHFGDGTVNILKGKSYVTVHNVAAAGRESYLEEVEEEMKQCNADIIGISAGFDNHEEDWGGTLLTEDYTQIGEMVRKAADRLGGSCFGILEGGYNHKVLGENVLSLIRGLSGKRQT